MTPEVPIWFLFLTHICAFTLGTAIMGIVAAKEINRKNETPKYVGPRDALRRP